MRTIRKRGSIDKIRRIHEADLERHRRAVGSGATTPVPNTPETKKSITMEEDGFFKGFLYGAAAVLLLDFLIHVLS